MRLGCDPRGVQEIIRDKSGEPLAIALAALAMEPSDAARTFLSSEPDISHSVERIRTLMRITSELSVNASRRLLSAMLGQSLAGDATRHRRYEQGSDVALLAGREKALRRASSLQTGSLTSRERVAQQRS